MLGQITNCKYHYIVQNVVIRREKMVADRDIC